MSWYPPFDVRVVTPRLQLVGATDEMLDRLAPIVHAGGATADPPPWDDPNSFYEADPDVRVAKWMQGVWRGRGVSGPERWRLYFAVVVDGEPVGTQDLIGEDFSVFRGVESSSWIAAEMRGRGIGAEARAAILHLAFEGLGAGEANSVASTNNVASNRISEQLGYVPNGSDWATHQGVPTPGQRWLLTRERWAERLRDDIELHGLEPTKTFLGM